mmetsp:Transcript_78291/g.253238  ORF Transcript_78291/g.253238 Transcript_78291/m.253238 type:complete len:397 (+) Transcript_78291:69-1259(+)
MSSRRSGFMQQVAATRGPLPIIPEEFDGTRAIKPLAGSRSARENTSGISGVAWAHAAADKAADEAADEAVDEAADEAALRQLDRTLFGSLPEYKATDFAIASRSAGSGHGDDCSKAQTCASHCAPATDKLGGVWEWLGRDIPPQHPATDNLDGLLDWVGRDMLPQHKEMDYHNAACPSECSAHDSDECSAGRVKAQTWPMHSSPSTIKLDGLLDAVGGDMLPQHTAMDHHNGGDTCGQAKTLSEHSSADATALAAVRDPDSVISTEPHHKVRPPRALRMQSIDVRTIRKYKHPDGTFVDLSVARSWIQKHVTSGAAPARLDEASSALEIMTKMEGVDDDELLADDPGQLPPPTGVKLRSETGHRAAENARTKLPSIARDLGHLSRLASRFFPRQGI